MTSVEATAAAPTTGAAAEVSPELKAKVKRQVEFYFSDSNFRKDTFLRGKAAEDPDGYVSIDVLLTFNRLKSLTTDPEVIVSALSDSATLDVNAEKKAIRRVNPLPEEDNSDDCTIYVKAPFPINTTIDGVTEWASAAGKVVRVVLRRAKNKEKSFKGSVFIEFASTEDAKKALDAIKSGELKFEDRQVMSAEPIESYYERKREERNERQKAKQAAKAQKKAGDEVAEEEREFKKDMTPGLILRISNLGEGASVDTLQVFLNTVGELKFAEYDTNTRVAHCRFASPEEAKKAADALNEKSDDAKKAADTDDFVAEVLTGEEETNYWEKIWAFQLAKFKAFQQRKKNRRFKAGHKRGRGGREASKDDN